MYWPECDLNPRPLNSVCTEQSRTFLFYALRLLNFRKSSNQDIAKYVVAYKPLQYFS